MTVKEALEKRKSVRAFLDKKVEKEKIETLLKMAKNAPSGVNIQPWIVSVLSGKKKKNLETKVIEAFDNKVKGDAECTHYPSVWNEPYKSRRKETGLAMYKALDIKREDKDRQIEQWRSNYKAFDAPVSLYFFIDTTLALGSYVDYGMFLQSIMLSALELGLATCPQGALAEFPDIIKKEFTFIHI